MFNIIRAYNAVRVSGALPLKSTAKVLLFFHVTKDGKNKSRYFFVFKIM